MPDDHTETESEFPSSPRPVTVRLNAEQAARLDAWIKEQSIDGLSRAAAIRRLLDLLLA